MYCRNRLIGPKGSDRMTKSVDPDMTAPPGAVWMYTVYPDLSV